MTTPLIALKHMQSLGRVEAASYKPTTPLDNVSSRNKTVPPPDWTQFALDPLILQQCYAKFQHEPGEELAKFVATQVGASLTSDSLLPAPLPPPTPDQFDFRAPWPIYSRVYLSTSGRSSTAIARTAKRKAALGCRGSVVPVVFEFRV